MSFAMRIESGQTWVSRTDPFGRLTVKRLAALGIDAIALPALKVRALDVAPLMPAPDALVFTSLNGVRHHPLWPGLRDLPVFAVGDRTARRAMMMGYRNIRSAAGDVRDLAHLIRREMPGDTMIMHLGALRPAGDLAAELATAGIAVRSRAVYDTVETDRAAFDALLARCPSISTILVYSPRAASHLASWLHRSARGWKGKVIAISAAAATPFAGLPGVEVFVARAPNEAAMLSLMTRTSALTIKLGMFCGARGN